MTSDQDLRDLLSTGAHGPTRPPAEWDDIVRRGHHHRRVTRLRNGLALGSVAVVVALGAVVLADRAGDDGQGVVSNDPGTSTTTSTTVLDPGLYGPGITQARAIGAFVTVLTAPEAPAAGFDPCVARHPQVTETATEVTVELVNATISSGSAWTACQASTTSGWGTIELIDPLGDRPLIDASTGQAVPVTDGTTLLFPTALPEPFVIGQWDEFAGVPGEGQMWTFAFGGDLLTLTITSDHQDIGECDGRPVDVRGISGTLCDSTLVWSEGGVVRSIEVTEANGEAVPDSIDLVAIADGLERLGG